MYVFYFSILCSDTPPSYTIRKDWGFVFTSISKTVFLQDNHLNSFVCRERDIQLCSVSCSFVLIDGAWMDGACSEFTTVGKERDDQGRVQHPCLSPAPEHLWYLKSWSAVVRCMCASPLHDLCCVPRDTWGCWNLWPKFRLWIPRSQLLFWLTATTLLSLILYCYPDIWLWFILF